MYSLLPLHWSAGGHTTFWGRGAETATEHQTQQTTQRVSDPSRPVTGQRRHVASQSVYTCFLSVTDSKSGALTVAINLTEVIKPKSFL